jgi:hypothetical protein
MLSQEVERLLLIHSQNVSIKFLIFLYKILDIYDFFLSIQNLKNYKGSAYEYRVNIEINWEIVKFLSIFWCGFLVETKTLLQHYVNVKLWSRFQNIFLRNLNFDWNWSHMKKYCRKSSELIETIISKCSAIG